MGNLFLILAVFGCFYVHAQVVDNVMLSSTTAANISAINGKIDSGMHLLSTTTGINLRATGNTLLYTVPTGKKCMVTGILVTATAYAGVLILAAAASVGTVGSTYDNILGATTFSLLNGTAAVGKVYSVPPTGLYSIANEGDNIYARVSIAATGATTLVCNVMLLGYLY